VPGPGWSVNREQLLNGMAFLWGNENIL
jgi:hypothetical protein